MINIFKSFFLSKKEDLAEKKVKKEQKNFDILKYDGVRATKMCGKLPYAIKCFTEALNIHEDVETRTYLASAYLASDQADEALEQMNRLVEMEPDNVEMRLMRVHVLSLLDKDVEVIQDCQHIISLDAKNHLAYFQMAKAKRAKNDILGAIANLTTCIALKDDFAPAYLLRGEILANIQHNKEALEDTEKAIALSPEDEGALLLRGRIYIMLDEMEKAAADFQQVMNLNPFNTEAYLLQGGLMIAENKLDEAIAFFTDAIEMNPEIPDFYAERGRARNLKGDKEGAFADMKKTIELNPAGKTAQLCNGRHTNFGEMYRGAIY